MSEAMTSDVAATEAAVEKDAEFKRVLDRLFI
jgi:hypothetical protein